MTVLISRLSFPKIYLSKNDAVALLTKQEDPIFSEQSFENFYQTGDPFGALYVLKHKKPHKSIFSGRYVLDFQGRVLEESIKNIQLVQESSSTPDHVIFQMGKLAENLFSLDFSYPLVPWLAFAIVLTRFDSSHL